MDQLLLSLVLVWLVAKAAGELMGRIGQTAGLGELLAGVLIGPGVLGLVHDSEILHALAELGVLVLLFEVGLESDLHELLRAGLQATLVALVGVVTPFVLGFGVMRWLDWPPLVAVFVGATLTATSVGITARTAGGGGPDLRGRGPRGQRDRQRPVRGTRRRSDADDVRGAALAEGAVPAVSGAAGRPAAPMGHAALSFACWACDWACGARGTQNAMPATNNRGYFKKRPR